MEILHIGKAGNLERYSDKKELDRGFEIVDLPMNLDDEAYLRDAKDADFIIADAMGRVSGGIICGMPNLKMIHSEGVGFNFFDIEAAKKQGVYVCNCKGMNAMAVAEQTILLMLGLLRNVKQGDIDVREGRQIDTKEGYMKNGDLYELGDFCIGLLGFGDIAKCVAKILKAFGAEVYYYDIFRASPEVESELGAEYLPMEKLLKRCNMISIHLPVTKETKNMINDDFFAKMRDGSYIINTSRGELVDSEALVRAMESGKIFKAGLDTVANEPVRKDNILLCQSGDIEKRILFSPHIGGVTASSFKRGYAMAWENIDRILKGEEPLRVVNK